MSAAEQRPEQRSEQTWLLELLGSDTQPAELPKKGVLTIGSSESAANLVVSGQGIADVHCAIGCLKGGGWALKDLGSQFGTWLNGERVQQARLSPGDLILVGSRRLRVVDPSQPREPAAAVAPPPPAANQEVGPGKTTVLTAVLPRLAGYRIEKKLGRGGMGDVYLAVQENLQRKVALKILAANLAGDADFVRRFQAEARAAAALSHPNVVVVHDVGEAAGYHYLTMEYMEGGNLEGRLGRVGKLGWEEVLHVLQDATKGLQYAELRGIVHRDIKPANLMQNEVGTTKLADLGLATHLEAEATEEGDKKIYGTPHFISPEQARGERVDCRSDLYSLGATAYRLLTGRTPFEGATTREILRGHFFDAPRPIAELVQGVPPELERIVLRLLAKDPEDRYPSAGVLLTEIDRLRSASVHGIGPGLERRSRMPLVPLVIGAALVVLGAAGWWFLGRDRSEPGPRLPGPLAAQQDVDLPEPADLAPLPEVQPPVIRDDDTEMKLLETQAELEYVRIPSEYTPAERRDELHELAAKFSGTGVATRALEEASEIDRTIQGATAVAVERKTERDRLVAALEQAAREAGPSPAEILRRLSAVPGQAELAALEPDFAAKRRSLYARSLRSGLEAVKRDLAAAEALAEGGDFTAFETRLAALLPALALPEFPADVDASMGVKGEIEALSRELTARQADLANERQRWADDLVRKDAATFAAGLGGATGLERELRSLDFAAADARLAALEKELATEAARAAAAELRRSLAAGHGVLTSVGEGFDTWRRKTLRDPREKRGRAARTATAADARCVTLDMGGELERVEWAEFGANAEALNQLFHERLARAYTEEELAGIDFLVRSAAVLQAIDACSEMLDGEPDARFDQSEADEMVAPFLEGVDWAGAHGSDELAREQTAAKILAQALVAASERSWSLTVAALERLIEEYQDTLLVRFLSNG
jgi:hypothetical protein